MAIPLESAISFTQSIKPIFVFIMVWLIIYGTLRATKVLFNGDERLSALLAFIFGILFILFPGLTEAISIAVPWVAILIMVILFIILIFMFAGVKSETITKNIFQESVWVWTIVLVVLGIFFAALSQVYGPIISTLSSDQAAQQGLTYDVARIIFNPKLLGFLLIIAIASQTMKLIVR